MQYGDWKGTAAADRADQNDAEHWLEKNGKKEPGEFLVGLELWAGEHYGKHEDQVSVMFLLASAGDHDAVLAQIESNDPLKVRRLREEMKIVDFLGLFKRFSVALSAHGMLNDRQYTYSE